MVSMSNRLSTEQRARVVGCLVEGMSIRATVRVTGAAKNTITKLLVDLGQACSEYQDGALTNLPSTRIECDEIWSFCHCGLSHSPGRSGGSCERVDEGVHDLWGELLLAGDGVNSLAP